MGNALIMMAVSEEQLAFSKMYVRDEEGRPVPVERKRGEPPPPGAYWMLPVPKEAVWRPPDEPFREHGLNWHWDAELLAAQDAAVRRSIARFVNGHLARLDRMVRTGWYIVERVRVMVSEFAHQPHGPTEKRPKRVAKTGIKMGCTCEQDKTTDEIAHWNPSCPLHGDKGAAADRRRLKKKKRSVRRRRP